MLLAYCSVPSVPACTGTSQGSARYFYPITPHQEGGIMMACQFEFCRQKGGLNSTSRKSSLRGMRIGQTCRHRIRKYCGSYAAYSRNLITPAAKKTGGTTSAAMTMSKENRVTASIASETIRAIIGSRSTSKRVLCTGRDLISIFGLTGIASMWSVLAQVTAQSGREAS